MDMPSWFLQGTAPQWGVFIVVLLAFLRLVIPWRQQDISTQSSTIKDLREDIKGLRERLDICEDTCNKRDATILGMKKQAISQQISFARLLMKALGQDSPELQHMISTLQDLEKDLEEPIFLESNTNEFRP